MTHLPNITDPPPAIRTNYARLGVLAMCALALAAGLFIVISSIGRSDDEAENDVDSNLGQIEQYSPGTLTDEDILNSDEDYSDMAMTLDEGGWMGQYDEENNPIQLYRARRLSPLPDGVFEMESLELILFLSGNRVIHMTGNEARARRVRSDLFETGRLSGDVTIRMFESTEDQQLIDFRTASPTLIITTTEASFDNLQGEIRCPDLVNVQSTAVEFKGRDLMARYDEINGLQELRVKPTEQPIRIVAGQITPPNSDERENSATGELNADSDTAPSANANSGNDRASQAPPPAAEAEAFSVYQAVFGGNVQLWRGAATRDEAEQHLVGDLLELTFSLESSGIESALSRNLPRSPTKRTFVRNHRRHSMIARLAALLLGTVYIGQEADVLSGHSSMHESITPPPAADDLYLSFAGELVVRPVKTSRYTLATANDVAFEMSGVPVTLTDVETQATAECGRLSYQTSVGRLTLLATDDAELWIKSPELLAGAMQFDFVPETNRGYFIDRGIMHLTGKRAQSFVDANAGGDGNNEQVAAADGLDIHWQDGVELTFAETQSADENSDDDRTDEDSASRLRLDHARFSGGVVINEQRFNLASDELAVAFDSQHTSQDELIEEIVAIGNVVARGLDEQGRIMRAGHLLLEFETTIFPDGKHKSNPTRIVATEQPRVADRTQSIKSESLIAELSVAEQNDVTSSSESQFGEMQVDTITAEGSVEITLDNGAVATGEKLIVFPESNSADLTGKEVVVRGNEDGVAFTANGTHAKVSRVNGRAHVDMLGAGTAEIIDQRTFDRQTINFSWDDQLSYEEGGKGSGWIDLRGNVVGTSESALEKNTMSGVSVVLSFAEAADNEDINQPIDSADADSVSLNTKRTLRTLVVKGDAKVESRTWLKPGRIDKPRIMYITSQHIEYDQGTMEAYVPGAGTLFVSDHRKDETDTENNSSTQTLSGRGDTLFEWTKEMRMKELQQDRYQMTAEGNIAMIHSDAERDADGQLQSAQLTCQSVIVELNRRGSDSKVPGLDFGGSTEIEKFEAIGSVMVNAGDKTVDCQRLNYSTNDNIAEIYGSRDIPAEVSTARNPVPAKAEAFKWDLAADRFTVLNLSGSGGQ